jgi:hypothetical protein
MRVRLRLATGATRRQLDPPSCTWQVIADEPGREIGAPTGEWPCQRNFMPSRCSSKDPVKE